MGGQKLPKKIFTAFKNKLNLPALSEQVNKCIPSEYLQSLEYLDNYGVNNCPNKTSSECAFIPDPLEEKSLN